jgi:hypothetical protein
MRKQPLSEKLRRPRKGSYFIVVNFARGGGDPPWVSRRIKLRSIRSGEGQSFQKFLNLSCDNSVKRTVRWMFLCPMYTWVARVSWPLEAR